VERSHEVFAGLLMPVVVMVAAALGVPSAEWLDAAGLRGVVDGISAVASCELELVPLVTVLGAVLLGRRQRRAIIA
jgi:hypothetical protein